MPEIAEAVQRLAIYARVSTDEQREGQTIDSQISELQRYANDRSCPVVGVYKDDGWSGAVMERPELDRLRDDARQGVFDAVLINDVDRLARDVAHLGVIKRDLEKAGIRVIFRKLPTETSPTANLMVNILGSFAEFERELIADRTRRGRRHKIEVRKQYLGSNTAYGYRYTPMDRITGAEGALQIEPIEARVVEQMFAWVDTEGLSARKVLNRLNERNIPPRRGAKSWAKSSVLRILHCETYAGVWHYNKHQSCEPKSPVSAHRYRRHSKCSIRVRPKNEWIPLELPEVLRLIPRERWERVQHRLQQNIAFSPRNAKHSYLLKGLVHCGFCAAAFVGEPSHGNFYYRCSKRCKRIRTITEHILNGAIQSALQNVLTNPSIIIEPLKRLEAAAERASEHNKERTIRIESGLKRLEIEEQRVLDAYRSGAITAVQLAGQLEKVKSRRAVLELERSSASSAAPQMSDHVQKSVLDYCSEAATNLDQFGPETWTELLRTVIDSITFYDDRITIRGRIPVPGFHQNAVPLNLTAPVP